MTILPLCCAPFPTCSSSLVPFWFSFSFFSFLFLSHIKYSNRKKIRKIQQKQKASIKQPSKERSSVTSLSLSLTHKVCRLLSRIKITNSNGAVLVLDTTNTTSVMAGRCQWWIIIINNDSNSRRWDERHPYHHLHHHRRRRRHRHQLWRQEYHHSREDL